MLETAGKYLWPVMVLALAVCSASRSVQDSASAAEEARLAAVADEQAKGGTCTPAEPGAGEPSAQHGRLPELVTPVDPWARAWGPDGGARVASGGLIGVRAVRPAAPDGPVSRGPARLLLPPESLHHLAPLWPCGPPRCC